VCVTIKDYVIKAKNMGSIQGKFMPNVVEVYTMVKYFKANLLNNMITIGSSTFSHISSRSITLSDYLVEN